MKSVQEYVREGFKSPPAGALHTMLLLNYIDTLKQRPEFGEAIVYHHYLKPQGAKYSTPLCLSPKLREALVALGFKRLYTHQAEALEYLKRGRHVLVSTPTASGKSLIYNVAVLEEILRNPNAKALYVFPLKALEQDQMKALAPWLQYLGNGQIQAAIYDGDTTHYQRKKIRSHPPHILFTNPDMLHRGILPYHEQWRGLLSDLRYIVLDEVHTYRGIFGSHVNQIIKRLKRLCTFYGSYPQFILISATISNPGLFGATLIGEEVTVVEDSGSPRAGQHFLFFNPTLSSNFSAARLFADCIHHGFRTIAFTQSRKVTELMHLWVSQLSPRLSQKVSSYRAGFLPSERREVEKRLACGELLGVISTSALEMGIDIGFLDICLLVGYPGSIINTWQRGGRVGRGGKESLIVLIAKPDALDQYFMKHPKELFERTFEAAFLDPQNPHVVKAHLPCAAKEMPLTVNDSGVWGKELVTHLETLEVEGTLARSAEGEEVWYSVIRTPHLKVDIRTTGETFTIFEKTNGQAIGTIDGIRALKECHPGAVYLHRGEQYQVVELILNKKDIIVERARVNYFTRPRSEKETEILSVTNSRPVAQFIVREGRVKVTEYITGYEKRALPGQELLGVHPLELPPQVFETTGFWIEIEPMVRAYVEGKGLHFMGAIHAVEHAAIGIFPLFALCDRNDVGGISYQLHPALEKSAIFIYDGYPGGVGLSRVGFEVVEELLHKALELISECECEEGCPSCIHSPKCGAGNKPLDKEGAVLVLKALLGQIPLSQMEDLEGQKYHLRRLEQDKSIEVGLQDPRILYLDLETQKSAQEVGGWQNSHLMRVSVVVVYDTKDETYYYYDETNMEKLFSHLKEADLVVGFNIKGFDYKVLGAYLTALDEIPTFDILESVFSSLGFRLSLDHLAEETLNVAKQADGLQAIQWFRQGEMDKLREYCKQDVEITKALFLHGLEKGFLVYREKTNGRRLRLLVDWDLNSMLMKK